MKRRIYIAGPMRGKPGYNYSAFHQAAERLRHLGWQVINPAVIGAGVADPDDIEGDGALLHAVMAAERRLIACCDAIYLLRGWQDSTGARAELAYAITECACEIFLEGEPVLGGEL